MLISPKRCSTRKISRLSDRLAGRGTIRKWTEREGRCAAALRTDMAAVVTSEVLKLKLRCNKVRKWVTELTEGSHPGVSTSRVNRVAGSRSNVRAWTRIDKHGRVDGCVKWFIW